MHYICVCLSCSFSLLTAHSNPRSFSSVVFQLTAVLPTYYKRKIKFCGFVLLNIAVVVLLSSLFYSLSHSFFMTVLNSITSAKSPEYAIRNTVDTTIHFTPDLWGKIRNLTGPTISPWKFQVISPENLFWKLVSY